MRIISGDLKGKKILTPLDNSTRPLKDIVRESIFNILEHSNKISSKIYNSKVLDLFSGTGSFGIECLSRGVKKVYFCESYKPSLKILKKNIINLELNENSVVIENDVYKISNQDTDNNKIDLIYLDPPFKDKKINNLLENIKNLKIAQEKTLIVIHRNRKLRDNFTKDFKIIREKNYGLSKIIFGKILF